ncbi:MAG: thioesterase family protein [Flavobacteriaceae bacterium]|nr:thioesterase family protein [Flavobacteriaceae bacterium]
MKFLSKKIQVRYAETDKMGIVHHSNYLLYFEQARIELLDYLDTPYIEMENNGVISPVVEVSLKYHNPLSFGDTYQIEIQTVKNPRASLELTYRVKNQNEKLVCTGYTKLAFMSAETKKIIRVPGNLVSKIQSER